nr:MAG TPA: hypothetical protein [Caudoviricetes sp.]
MTHRLPTYICCPISSLSHPPSYLTFDGPLRPSLTVFLARFLCFGDRRTPLQVSSSTETFFMPSTAFGGGFWAVSPARVTLLPMEQLASRQVVQTTFSSEQFSRMLSRTCEGGLR